MYRNINDAQTSIYDFILPFGGHLKEDNRWVKLRKTINWEIVDEEYRWNFRNKMTGQKVYNSSVAFGSLYIQRMLGLTDRELVEQIAENPYMQYFLGYKEYRCEKPFDPSLLVTFRKRLPEDVINRISERSFIDADGKDDDDKNDKDGGSSSSGGGGDSANKNILSATFSSIEGCARTRIQINLLETNTFEILSIHVIHLCYF